jgi:hypothetical protein
MTPEWRKSSRSGGGQGGQSDCVEVAALHDAIGLRDSKAPEAGHLIVSVESFSDLLARAKRDELSA